MNFAKGTAYDRPRVMADGDLVIVYERHDALSHIYLSANEIFNNKFGAFHHNDMIGKPFGSKVVSKCTEGWIHLLEPTPELWASALNTRTQIVNELDSCVITLNLDVFPGCVVVESGTGSGCMTLSLARAVYPNGHVYSYEYNSVRAETARDEFQRLGVSDQITVTHRDVCGKFDVEGGGGFSGVAPHTADAVFLDLPEPWLALDHALQVLKPGGNICCYSPCMEQVMKTCEKLRELKYHSIRMQEVRQRPYDGRVIDIETLDLGLEPSSSTSAESQKPSSKNNSGNSSCGSSGESGDDESRKRKAESDVSGSITETVDTSTMNKTEYRTFCQPRSSVNGVHPMKIARPIAQMKGHTAFLTFAVGPLGQSLPQTPVDTKNGV